MINANMDFQFPPQEMKKLLSDIRRGVMYNIQSKLVKAVPYLEKLLPVEIKRRIEQSDVIYELKNGQLRYDLGITYEEAVAVSEKIPDIIAKSVQVRILVNNDTVSFIVEMIRDSYEDILNMPEASFLQTFTQSNPAMIHWLDWLLTKGDNIIIGDFRVKYTPGNSNSRSGGAIMIKSGAFRIPPQYSGVEDNNFITRALEGIDVFIYKELQKFMQI